MEAVAECFLFFYIFIMFPPALSILLMCGVYSTQSLAESFYGIYDMCYKARNNQNYISIDGIGNLRLRYRCLIALVLVAGFLCQTSGLASITVFLAKAYYDSRAHMLGLVMVVLCLIVLSFSWSGRVLKRTFAPSEKSKYKAKIVMLKTGQAKELKTIARWKASKLKIASTVADCNLYFPLNRFHSHIC